MSTPENFTVELTIKPGGEYEEATLRGKHTIATDEPEWLPDGLAGNDEHPAPVDFLLMSLASCQASVLRQCLESNGIEEYVINCDAIIDEYHREVDHPDEMPPHTALRIGHITVTMRLTTTPEYSDAADRCLMTYDKGCIVGQSIGGGVDYTPLTSLEVTDSPIGADN